MRGEAGRPVDGWRSCPKKRGNSADDCAPKLRSVRLNGVSAEQNGAGLRSFEYVGSETVSLTGYLFHSQLRHKFET
eukprot:scaffold4944_cov209-Pinguiococcus_pyrenoidosus.AAC.1